MAGFYMDQLKRNHCRSAKLGSTAGHPVFTPTLHPGGPTALAAARVAALPPACIWQGTKRNKESAPQGAFFDLTFAGFVFYLT
jgi:hypothetical protein